MAISRVTVTLPEDVLAEIDRTEANRSRFVLEAVTRELARRREAALRVSLKTSHSELMTVAEAGIAEWGRALAPNDGQELVSQSEGRPVRWTPGKGWKER